MAKEAKTLNVNNYEEQAVIEEHQAFGWSLHSSQRIFNRDSHLETRNGDLYSVTKTVDFTKLVFERDTCMSNYYKLKSLEEEYEELQKTIDRYNSEEYSRMYNKYPPSTSLEQFAYSNWSGFQTQHGSGKSWFIYIARGINANGAANAKSSKSIIHQVLSLKKS